MHSALRVQAAHTRARVPALLAHTGLRARALPVGDTLGSAAGEGVAFREARSADTPRHAVLIPAVGVRTARVGEAGRRHRRGGGRLSRRRHWAAGRERIAFIADGAVAHGHVCLHPTLGPEAADARAWVDAFVALAGL